MSTSASLINSLSVVVDSNMEAVAALGARFIVTTRLIDSMLPLLTTAQSLEAIQAFRDEVEEAMGIADDLYLPGHYHSAFMEQVNTLLTALSERAMPRPSREF